MWLNSLRNRQYHTLLKEHRHGLIRSQLKKMCAGERANMRAVDRDALEFVNVLNWHSQLHFHSDAAN